jgi:prefoldin subunit 5
MEGEPTRIDINQASKEALTAIPGVGPAIADRIIAARPFASLEELTAVPGISQAFLDKARDYFAEIPLAAGESKPESPAEAGLPPFEPEPGVEEQPAPAEWVPEVTPPEEEAPVEPAPVDEPPTSVEEAPVEPAGMSSQAPRESKPVSRREAGWYAAILAVLVLVLSLICNLGILNAVNGSLDYARSQDMAQLSANYASLSDRADTLQSDLDSLRTRMDALDALSGKITTLQQSNQSLQDDLKNAQSQIDDLQNQTQGFASQIEDIQSQSNVFQSFLDGLRSLLNNAQK